MAVVVRLQDAVALCALPGASCADGGR